MATINGTPNGVTYGTSGNDTIIGTVSTTEDLRGLGGDDTLISKAYNATLTGGDGADIFAYTKRVSGRDVITDFTLGVDKLDLRSLGVSDISQLIPLTSQLGVDTLIQISPGTYAYPGIVLDTITLRGVSMTQLLADPGNFIFATGPGITVSGYLGAQFATAAGSVLKGSNWLLGGIGNDTLTGQDNLYGGAGNDTLSGRNNLHGGDGNDTLAGNSDLHGDDGNDTLAGYSVLYGDDGNDTLTGFSNLFGGAGNDHLLGTTNLDGGTGDDVLTLTSGYTAAANLTGGAGADLFQLGGARNGFVTIADFTPGVDRIDLAGTRIADMASLQALLTEPGTNSLITIAGLTITFQGVTNAALVANPGSFVFDTTTGPDTYHAGNGTETWTGTVYGDTYFGGAGSDAAYGGDGNDVLYGGTGTSALFGGAGDDELVSNRGSDTLTGGAGADLFRFTTHSGRHDVITDFTPGVDRIDLSALGIVDRSGLANLLTSSGGDTVLSLLWQGMTETITIKGIDPATLLASRANFIFATATGAPIQGTDKGSQLVGTAGADTIISGDGEDTLYGAGGRDTLVGWGTNDTLYGGNGNDILMEQNDYPKILGSATMTGGAGDDRFVIGANQSVTITDFTIGQDKLDLSALGIGDFETLATLLTQVGNDAVLRADPGGLYFPGMETTVTLQGVSVAALLASHASIRLAPSGTPAEAIARAYGNVVYGSSHADTLQGGDLNDVIYGGPGADVIKGGLVVDGGNDVIFGGAGADVIDGGPGDDRLTGGPGNDTFVFDGAAFGHDTITDFTIGSDHLDLKALGFVSTADLAGLVAQAGADTLITINANSSIRLTGINAATLLAHPEAFTLLAPKGRALFEGTSGNDVLTGSDHADALFGLAGNDTLIGGAGADVFYGGSGDDTMTGGGGPDRFVLDQQQSGNDVVTDFKLGQDRIDVSGDNVVSLVDLASHVTQFGTSTVISLGTQTLKLLNVDATALLADAGNFVFAQGTVYEPRGTISGFRIGVDKLDLSALGINDLGTAAVLARQIGADTVIEVKHGVGTQYFSDAGNVPTGWTDKITLLGVNAADLVASPDNFAFSTARGGAVIVGTQLEYASYADTLVGTAGNDVIKALPLVGSTNLGDLMFGGGGNDTIIGRSGGSVLYGGAGNDTLFGGAGNTLYGGAGADHFSFVAGAGHDVIADFNAAEGDRIDLSPLGSSLTLVSGTFTAANQVQLVVHDGITSVEVNLDSSPSTIELQIDVTSLVPVTAADLIF